MSLLLEAIEVLESRGSVGGSGDGYGLGVEENGDYGGGGSSESSSIGAAEESSLGSSSTVGGGGGDDEGGEEEVGSKMRRDSFCSLDELEDSLPTKRGLSNFFNGKSKSFATLSDVVTAPLAAADLAKPENPFNKRRRILLANKARWPRRGSCGSLSTVAGASPVPPHQPVVNSAANLFSLEEDEEEDDENSEQEEETQQQNQQEDEEDEDDSFPSPSSSSQLRKLKVKRNHNPSFRSPRSFSLGDLQHHAHQFS